MLRSILKSSALLSLCLAALAGQPSAEALAHNHDQVEAASLVSHSATLIQKKGRAGELDRAIRYNADLAGVELTRLNSRAGLGWQVSIFEAVGSEEKMQKFLNLLEAYKAIKEIR